MVGNIEGGSIWETVLLNSLWSSTNHSAVETLLCCNTNSFPKLSCLHFLPSLRTSIMGKRLIQWQRKQYHYKLKVSLWKRIPTNIGKISHSHDHKYRKMWIRKSVISSTVRFHLFHEGIVLASFTRTRWNIEIWTLRCTQSFSRVSGQLPNLRQFHNSPCSRLFNLKGKYDHGPTLNREGVNGRKFTNAILINYCSIRLSLLLIWSSGLHNNVIPPLYG